MSLYQVIHDFEMQRWVDQEYGGANTFKWLKGVETTATALAKMLEAAVSPVQSLTVELASDDLRQLYGGKALLQLEGEVRRLAIATKQHLAEITKAARAETATGATP